MLLYGKQESLVLSKEIGESEQGTDVVSISTLDYLDRVSRTDRPTVSSNQGGLAIVPRGQITTTTTVTNNKNGCRHFCKRCCEKETPATVRDEVDV